MLTFKIEEGLIFPIFCHFTQQNPDVSNPNPKYFYPFGITSQNKIPLINLFRYVSKLNYFSPTKTIMLQTKSNFFLNYSL